MDILSHVNKRIKMTTSVKLPFEALLAQYNDDKVSAFVKNFTLIYLEMAVGRLTPEETSIHTPSFLCGISRRSNPQTITLLHIVLPILGKWSKDNADKASSRQQIFHFDDHPQDVAVILNFFLNVLLYQPPSQRMMQQAQESNDASPQYPGLSPSAVEEITNKGKITWTSSRLTDAKLAILQFLMTSVFTDDERLRLFIIGVCDPNHQVVSTSEDGLRRWANNANLEEAAVIQPLYALYLGSTSKTSAAKDARAPASNAVKLRILQYLNKSVAACNMVSHMIQVVFDGIYGERSTSKLRRASLSFLQWVARMSKESSIAPVAPIVVSGLIKYINENASSNVSNEESNVGYAYIACGLILKKVPKLALEDMSILSLFFENLEREHPNTRSYIQDALSSMIEIFVDQPEVGAHDDELKDIILTAVQKNNPSSRYLALKYSNAIYPFASVFARYVCLLGHSSTVNKLEVKEEASRGLIPFKRSHTGLLSTMESIVPTSAMPSFIDLVNYISEHRPNEQYILESKTPVIKGYPIEVYTEILSFLRMILVLEANPENITIDQYMQDKVENSMAEDPVVMANFGDMISTWWTAGEESQRKGIEVWLRLIENALDPHLKDPVLVATASKCLLEIISLGPTSLSTTFKPRLNIFKNYALSNKEEARQLMSHIFGIIASDESIPQDEVESLLSEFCDILQHAQSKQNASTNFEQQHGSILAIGYLLGRCIYRARSVSIDVERRCIEQLTLQLEGNPGTTFYSLAAAACHALSEIGRVKPLPFPIQNESIGEKREANSMDVDGAEGLTVQMVVEKLAKLAKSCKDSKVQDKAVLALSHLSIPYRENSSLQSTVTDSIFAVADSKQVDLYFAGGEAWSVLAFGWKSQAMRKYKDIKEAAALNEIVGKDTATPTEEMQKTLEKIVKNYVVSDRSWYRQASCIWLLSLLKFGKEQPLIKTNLGTIHASFSRLLADRDEFTQEVASKGLGLVYEYGDAKIKEDMLFSLVGTFTEGRSTQPQSVTENTVLFEEGALGTTPDGNSITTYKELCSLASELNQPDLIYKFMNLANHNALWTSRRGAAFGFQNLMALAEKEMEAHLSRLIPKLYRYQFDPNPRVNQSMKAIWQSLVKDSQKTVDTYFDQIMEDILAGLGNRQWRIREASCIAVTDLVQGRQLSQIEPYLEQLWCMCFRTLDDIKGSVRQAATQTCRQLTKLTVHYCDPNIVSSGDGAKVMAIVMPFLLQKGIVSDAEDVQKFSLDAILRVCKSGAKLLKPYIPDLIDSLLQSLSSLEPQAMNYLSFHVDKYNISQEQLDNARLNGAKNSPMMEGIEHCVNQIDQDVMQVLAPRLIQIIKKGTGLPTKAGCARFIVTLVMNRRAVVELYADSILKALSGAIRSKNPVVRKSYATAVGYICQLATYDRLISLIKHLKKLYIEEEDEDSHVASAVTCVEITRFATDRTKAVASEIVPLLFYGEHDPEENFNKLWKDAWENMTAGTRSMVTMYADEILQFVQPLLSSASWKVKQTAALTVADMCKSGGKSVAKHVEKLMPIMITTLATRSWAGKEHVLDAFVQLCISASDYFDSHKKPSLADVAKIMIREAKRKNRTYQRHALVSLYNFLNAFGEKIDIYDQIEDFLVELCEMDENEAMEDEDNDNAKPLLLMVKANAFNAIVAGFRPKVFEGQAQHSDPLSQMLTGCLPTNVWNVQLAILNSLKIFIEHSATSSLQEKPIRQRILQSSIHCLAQMKYTAIRAAAIEVLEAAVAGGMVQDDEKTFLQASLSSSHERETVAALKERLQKLKQAIV
ncbi:proteasome stabiliser-domain-containing protein [Radiomyces spectabilis]|uniref:proteasome stabiliser-domain-containing protein n=1 Tax=Radiomyces spectabilis TaxID=64574 RepID=UPI00221E6E89|nr:proteasome stabiliser-domain-containing protein [Radiomyces spectabilis]KAI8374250.1 proteasome stabiliser-domain-containing protein [Radiomyces spectabilis]